MTESTDQKVARLMRLHGKAIANMRGLYEADSDPWSEKLEEALRTELAVQGEPVGDIRLSIGMGAVYDFAGFLTSRDTQITASSHDEAGSMVDALKEFCDKRGIHQGLFLDIKTWNQTTPQPVQPAHCEYCKGADGAYNDEGGWSLCHCQDRPAPQAPAPAVPVGGQGKVDWKQAFEAEQRKFQSETLRASLLTVLLKKWFQRNHDKGCRADSLLAGCDDCDLMRETEQLLKKPLNTTPAPSVDAVKDVERVILTNTQIIRDLAKSIAENGFTAAGQTMHEAACEIEAVVLAAQGAKP